MIPVVFAMRDKYSQRFMFFMIIGLSICLVSAQINTLLINRLTIDELNYSITLSPINEEILKAIPLMFFALVFAKEGDEIMILKCPANHFFHGICIKNWLLVKTTCPMCRSENVL